MRAVSTNRMDLGRGERKVSTLLNAGLRCRPNPIIVVDSSADRPGHQLAVDRLLASEFGVRVGDTVDTLMNSRVVVPAVDVLVDDGAELALIPD